MSDERCPECNAELSACGEMGFDGPRMDCRVCQLKARIRELEDELDGCRGAAAITGSLSRDLLGTLQDVMAAAGSEDPVALIEAAKKLPLTADGVRVGPNQDVFLWWSETPRRPMCYALEFGSVFSCLPVGGGCTEPMSETYSTREAAAQAARERGA